MVTIVMYNLHNDRYLKNRNDRRNEESGQAGVLAVPSLIAKFNQESKDMKESMKIGAFATVQYLDHIKTYLATGVGDLDGAIWAQATSEPRDIGNGQMEFTMVHEFNRVDGSRLSTEDVAVAIAVPGRNELSLTVQHKVVDATGIFAGRRGTFPSFGIHNTETGQGIQRFSGELV